MRKLIAITVLFLGLASTALGFPKNTGLVTDAANVLQPNELVVLEQNLRSFEQKTSVEFAVAIVPTLDGMDISTYRVKLFEAWGIGKKGKDNGVLLVVAMQERKVGIEVGYGLEGILNDGKVGAIIRNDIVPAFKQGQYSLGVANGVSGVMQAITTAQTPGDPITTPTTPTSNTDNTDVYIFIAFGVAIGIGIIIFVIVTIKDTSRKETFLDSYTPSSEPVYIPHYTPASPSKKTYSAPRSYEDNSSYRSSYSSSNDDDSYRSSSSSSSSSSPSFDFGGGSSGGGGADSSW